MMVAFWLAAFVLAIGAEAGVWRMLALFALNAVFGLLLLSAVQEGRTESLVRRIVAAQTAIIFIGLSIVPDPFSILSPAVVVLAATRFSTREAFAWAFGLAFLNLASATAEGPSFGGFFDGLIQAIIILVFATFANSLARAKAARIEADAALAELQTAHTRLQKYADQVEELAVSEERTRISRDLHDTIGHRLTVSIVQLEGASRIVADDQERAMGMINTVTEQLREGLGEVRRTVAMLRTPVGTDLSLPAALKQLASDFEGATHLRIAVSVPDSIPPLPDPQRLALYRAAQEALTNVQRHALASNASVTLQAKADAIKVIVSDDGVGVDDGAAGQGFGLRGMNERVALLGGKVEIKSTLGEGTTVTVTLPLGASS